MEVQYLMEPTILQNIPRETQTYALQDLVNLKERLSSNIGNIEQDLTNYITRYTAEQYAASLLKLQITQWNLISVKEVISVANKPINGLIYAKGEAEKRRVICNGILNKYSFGDKRKLAKEDRDTVKFIKEMQKNIREEIAQYKKRIATFNLTCVTKVELLKI